MFSQLVETSTRCNELIQSLTAEEGDQLTHFAERRLTHFGITQHTPKDLFQESVHAILRGGRKPNPQNLESQASFLNYLRGVINSIAEGWARTTRTHDWHHSSLDLIEEVVPAQTDVHEDIAFNDFKTQLFARLRQQAPARLLPTIDAWEAAPDGRIPSIVSRKHVCAVRELARKIVIELGMGPGGLERDERPNTTCKTSNR